MPRKQFQADLKAAIQGRHGVDSISHVQPGEDDGQLTFLFTHSSFAAPISITATAPDLSEYPNEHIYFGFAADDTPPEIASVVGAIFSTTDNLRAKTINQLLDLISGRLSRHAQFVDGGDTDYGSLSGLEEEDPDDQDDDEDDDFFQHDDIAPAGPDKLELKSNVQSTVTGPFQKRIREDLKCAKEAGFKISYFGAILEGGKCAVSISISARKLGISDEAMQAWKIDSSDYMILLVQYKEGYKSKDELVGFDAARLHRCLDMRLGASKHYKPSQQQVVTAFATNNDTSASTSSDSTDDTSPFRDTFISKPLNNLLNERLVPLLRLRDAGMSWKGAEDFYREHQGMSYSSNYATSSHYVKDQSSGYPTIIDADHMSQVGITRLSFPLLAMQFTLRHFVRSAEFCLVCHRKLDTTVEALKPYVCESPLCLYQYMALGFGPSIEHEILTQDKVVDLLISFCYTSAFQGRLKDFPNGLAFDVPSSLIVPIQETRGGMHGGSQAATSAPVRPELLSGKVEAEFDAAKQRVKFDTNKVGACPLQTGDWISISPEKAEGTTFHCRVTNACFFPIIDVGPLLELKLPEKLDRIDGSKGIAFARPKSDSGLGGGWHSAYVEKYAIKFDDLNDSEKRGVVCHLLGCLPSVKQIKEYLVTQRTPDLKKWVDRVSPAAIAVLRWVVASNRACILEVDPQRAVHGMKGWMQFRFAMGAPDKEHRFVTAVSETTSRLGLEYPTLFAWHGSMLQNWHSIIREGLHFNDTLNGRAFGNGVYHSPHCSTSLGYSGASGGHYYPATPTSYMWPSSALRISSAIALNEIVNAPREFVSQTPHYVVSQLDWIQTRYLFVQCSEEALESAFDQIPAEKRSQDPSRTPTGADGMQIVIPLMCTKAGKRKLANGTSPGPKGSKKSKKLLASNAATARKVIDLTQDDEDETVFENDNLSVKTDDEDLEIFAEQKSVELAVRKGPPLTDFVPGSLDHSSLPNLPMPNYANSVATRRLQQDLKALVAVQDHTPSHELGWYIDSAKIDNIYQWIIELHSFHMFNEKGKELPLVTDMKKHGIKSIVLELRFPGSYPMNPPFVRVIRPRFLPFQEGGGGHVTAGGAICHMLLTSDGWLPSNSIESVLLQIRMAMASTDPKPARLRIYRNATQDSYSAGEAAEAYKRACIVHGWTVPSDFNETAAGGQ